MHLANDEVSESVREFKVTDENCFYGFRPEDEGGPDCVCAIVEADNGYNLCVIHECSSFYPIRAPFVKFEQAVTFALGHFGTLRFQRVSLDDWAATPPGFLESMFHSSELVDALRGNAL